MPDLPAPLADLAAPLARLQPGVAAAVGVALLGWGGALWRLSQVTAGLLVGARLGSVVSDLSGNPTAGFAAAAILGVAAVVLFYLVERAAFAGVGAVAGVVVLRAAWPLAYGGAMPNLLLQSGAAVVGLALAALLHARTVQATTAVVGAWLVSSAVGRADEPWLVGSLALAGTLFQYWRGTPSTPPPPRKPPRKK